ncbi:MAG TPA: hypothetical protein VF267_02880 [Gammaproteobacteria bacterium]
MARIVFIPGKNPKPPSDVHGAQLWRCLLEGVRRANPEIHADLAGHRDNFHVVDWNREYYGIETSIAEDLPWIDALLHQHGPTAEDMEEARQWRKQLTWITYRLADSFPRLIRWFADDAARSTIEETHRYFMNVGGSAEIAHAKAIDALRPSLDAGEPVLLIGHSLGSVIAWNVLWLMTHEFGVRHKIDTWLTLGSPLGMRFVKTRLLGHEHVGTTRYPGCIREWINVSAVGDETALDARLRDDFHEMIDLGLVEKISDHLGRIYNHYRDDNGLNSHRIYGYLVNPVVGQLVSEWWYRQQRRARPKGVVSRRS